MKNLISVFFTAVLILLVASCSDYNEVVKGDDYTRKFEMANAYFEKGSTPKSKARKNPEKVKAPEMSKNDLLRSVTLYEQIYQRMPKTGEGELAYFRIGKAYYFAEDYYMAGYYLGAFTQRFPFSPKTQEALFLSAMCSVSNSPEKSLDQNETELAINNLQQFIDTYPESVLVDSCNKIMDKLRFKLESKDYDAVKLYAKTQNYRAAVTTASTFLEDYPRSVYKEEIYYLLVLNSYYLANNSIDNKKCERIEHTIERYSEFPDTKYKSEVNDISDKMHRDLDILCTPEKK
ncbi:MAG: hypothetical protein RIQ76_954 [Pseudomonadota bacterium]